MNDLRVKQGSQVTVGQVLASKPPEALVPAAYKSRKYQRAVEKQRKLLEKTRQIVEEEGLPHSIIQHEEAKLEDLQFAAKEYQLLSNQPKAIKETIYRCPVNGTISRITPISSTDGLLKVELVIELD
jgi:hypothetical protein